MFVVNKFCEICHQKSARSKARMSLFVRWHGFRYPAADVAWVTKQLEFKPNFHVLIFTPGYENEHMDDILEFNNVLWWSERTRNIRWITLNDCGVSWLPTSRKFPRLEGLELVSNKIGAFGDISGFISIENAESLIYLDFRDNPVCYEDKNEIINAVLQVNPHITVINCTRITPRQIKDAIAAKDGDSVNFENCGRFQIYAALRMLPNTRIALENPMARVIDLSTIKAVKLSGLGLVAFSFTLFQNAVFLDLSNNEISELCGTVGPQLRVVNLWCNPVPENVVRAYCQANHKLQIVPFQFGRRAWRMSLVKKNAEFKRNVERGKGRKGSRPVSPRDLRDSRGRDMVSGDLILPDSLPDVFPCPQPSYSLTLSEDVNFLTTVVSDTAFLLVYKKRESDDQLVVDEIVQLYKTHKYSHRVQFVDGCVTTLRKYLPVREGGFEWDESVNVHHSSEIPDERDYILYTGLPDLTLHLHLISYLNLVHCEIDDITAISMGCHNIKTLLLARNRISDLSPLERTAMAELKELDLSAQDRPLRAEQCRYLRYLPKLEILHLSGAEDFDRDEFLSTMRRLQFLDDVPNPIAITPSQYYALPRFVFSSPFDHETQKSRLNNFNNMSETPVRSYDRKAANVRYARLLPLKEAVNLSGEDALALNKHIEIAKEGPISDQDRNRRIHMRSDEMGLGITIIGTLSTVFQKLQFAWRYFRTSDMSQSRFGPLLYVFTVLSVWLDYEVYRLNIKISMIAHAIWVGVCSLGPPFFISMLGIKSPWIYRKVTNKPVLLVCLLAFLTAAAVTMSCGLIDYYLLEHSLCWWSWGFIGVISLFVAIGVSWFYVRISGLHRSNQFVLLRLDWQRIFLVLICVLQMPILDCFVNLASSYPFYSIVGFYSWVMAIGVTSYIIRVFWVQISEATYTLAKDINAKGYQFQKIYNEKVFQYRSPVQHLYEPFTYTIGRYTPIFEIVHRAILSFGEYSMKFWGAKGNAIITLVGSLLEVFWFWHFAFLALLGLCIKSIPDQWKTRLCIDKTKQASEMICSFSHLCNSLDTCISLFINQNSLVSLILGQILGTALNLFGILVGLWPPISNAISKICKPSDKPIYSPDD